ncbi:30S ribosomal protein S4 [Candidatus Dojkabacteria bacterium]|uniref:Small ribosomal subunit protein uS4 n=1 Tax=Candidatus Dojkabacteria bacterium TaxID=2099670 RepID=A0A955KWF3_9BACT|nr:30S ribosomal protein S4 [Candidatus Dojkabacteria bacterium]
MGRYTGPKGKLSRREGINLFLKGARSFSEKNAVARKPYPPGQHGNARRTRLSNYGLQLRQKQAVKRIYGVRERQLKNMYKEAVRVSKTSGTDRGLEFLRILETRLDNVVYMLGLAPSRAAARQYVTHKHVKVNDQVLNIPSYNVQIGDITALKETKKHLKPAEPFFDSPTWLAAENLGGKVLDLPSRDDIDEGIQENLIIEFYSR